MPTSLVLIKLNYLFVCKNLQELKFSTQLNRFILFAFSK